MGVSYGKLFKLMKMKGIKKVDLRKIGLSPTVVDRLVKNNNVNTSTIIALCKILDCQPGDIMDYIPETDNTSKQLFDLRTQHNLTPTQVAEQLEVPYQEYIKYESGSNNPKLDILLKACKLYNVPQSYFGINSDLVAVGNKGYSIENHGNSEIITVTAEEFEAVKEFIAELRNK